MVIPIFVPAISSATLHPNIKNNMRYGSPNGSPNVGMILMRCMLSITAAAATIAHPHIVETDNANPKKRVMFPQKNIIRAQNGIVRNFLVSIDVMYRPFKNQNKTGY